MAKHDFGELEKLISEENFWKVNLAEANDFMGDPENGKIPGVYNKHVRQALAERITGGTNGKAYYEMSPDLYVAEVNELGGERLKKARKAAVSFGKENYISLVKSLDIGDVLKFAFGLDKEFATRELALKQENMDYIKKELSEAGYYTQDLLEYWAMLEPAKIMEAYKNHKEYKLSKKQFELSDEVDKDSKKREINRGKAEAYLIKNLEGLEGKAKDGAYLSIAETACINSTIGDIIEAAKKCEIDYRTLGEIKRTYGNLRYKELKNKAEEESNKSEDKRDGGVIKAYDAISLLRNQKFGA